jgi:hypothetical protein
VAIETQKSHKYFALVDFCKDLRRPHSTLTDHKATMPKRSAGTPDAPQKKKKKGAPADASQPA